MSNENSFMRLWEQIRSYLSLRLEYAKLTAADKLTVVITLLCLGLIAVLLGTVVLFFVSLAVVQFIAPYTGLGWAYMIMAGSVALLLIALVMLRKPLLINPLSRFLTRVILR